MSDQYRFTIVGNAVTEVFEVERGFAERQRIDANETYTVLADGTVRKIETYGTYREIEEYVDSNGDGIYAKARKFYESDTGAVVADREDDRDGFDDDRDGYDDDLDRDGRDDDDFRGGDDDDRVFASLGRDTLRGGAGHDLLDGGRDDDDLFGDVGDDDLFGDLGDDHLDGGDGDDDLFGGAGDDVLVGGAGNDSLTGGDGNDSVTGLDGDDLIVGGTGRGNDDYDGGAGIDSITYASATRAVRVDMIRGEATGRDIDRDRLAAIENVTGGSGSDRISGDAASNALDGGAGNDRIDARDGDDYIVGGLGKDVLTGGSGADTFAYGSATESQAGRGRDLIRDFRLVEGDKIDLSGIDADTTVEGDQTFVIVGALTGDAGQLTMRGKIISGDIDGDGRADFEIQVAGLSTQDLADAVIL